MACMCIMKSSVRTLTDMVNHQHGLLNITTRIFVLLSLVPPEKRAPNNRPAKDSEQTPPKTPSPRGPPAAPKKTPRPTSLPLRRRPEGDTDLATPLPPDSDEEEGEGNKENLPPPPPLTPFPRSPLDTLLKDLAESLRNFHEQVSEGIQKYSDGLGIPPYYF
ncbi:E4 protein [Mesocricetus auratus papillomavirus 1]|uniref:E4 protein n=1 Tax=Mesocricetus auratus papillomavirus 1 TaxID=1408129 RepID=U6EJ46_9PAPI|nr:E4 protein [Mesocricetus auratus papillomavirus 1]CDI44929.1 E4 protein [Mesocricetus auratus papillomavirus 1]